MLSLTLVAGGCATRIHAPDVSESTAKACATVTANLPHTLIGKTRREVTNRARGAAWGDPAIVLTCGVPKPQSQTNYAACQTVNGFDWYVPRDQLGSSPREITMTTIGRTPRIQVVVPAKYWPPAGVMAELAEPLSAHTHLVRRCH